MNKQDRRATLLMRRPSVVRFALVAMLGPMVLAALLFWLNYEYGRSETLRLQSGALFDRQMGLMRVSDDLKDAETAERGFLLTHGDAVFLAPYEPARAAAIRDLRSVQAGSGRVFQLRIEGLAATKFAEMDETLAQARRGDWTSAQALVRQGQGRRTMDRLQSAISAQIGVERRQLHDVRSRSLAERATKRRIALGSGIACILLLTALLYAAWRLTRARFDASVAAFEAAERNETILNSTVDAMLILNPSGAVEAVNPAATAMLGYEEGEIKGRDIAEVIDIAAGHGSFQQRVGLIDGHLRRSFLPDRSARRRDGGGVPVDVAMGVMVLPSGDHLVLSLRDISERKRLEQLKDDLMSTVSHELRTPLTSIVGSLGLLRAGSAGDLPAAAVRLVAIAENNSRRLIRLINDMLDIDRIESGALDMHREPIDLRSIIERATQGSEGSALSKDVRIVVTPGDDPAIVMADADRLLQVVTNLLSNAIRFTPAGGTVRLSLESADAAVVVAVDDAGPGVPAEFRHRIFGRFERAHGESGVQGGAGLGLAISREIVARHDGRIWFENAPGGGARFAFALDQVRPAAATRPDAARVLICEHDTELAGHLVDMVVEEGCAYELATDVTDGRDALRCSSFDAVLIDLHFPKEGGLAFAHAARAGSPPLLAPIIVVARDAQGDGEAPSGLDLVDWIEKPADVKRLAEALRRALARSGKHRPVVLHLDNDEDLPQVVAAALEPDTRIVAATDLDSARAILEDISPDAAILDLRLAEGSGLDLIPFLVDADGLAIPTIIYSAQDVPRELASQVAAVLVKACGSLPDLKATLHRVVGSRERAEPE